MEEVLKCASSTDYVACHNCVIVGPGQHQVRGVVRQAALRKVTTGRYLHDGYAKVEAEIFSGNVKAAEKGNAIGVSGTEFAW